MDAVSKSNIPAFLYASSFYQALSNDEDERAFSIPKLCMKRNLHVSNNEDFLCLLYTLRFWMVNNSPMELVAYMLENISTIPDEMLAEFEKDMPEIGVIRKVINTPAHKRMNVAIESGLIVLVKYLHEQGYVFSRDDCEVAACTGNLDCLIYAHEHGCPWDFFTCYGAVVTGNLDCLIYALDRGCSVEFEHSMERRYNKLQSCDGRLREHCDRFFVARADRKWEYFSCLLFGVSRGLPKKLLVCLQRRAFDEPEIMMFLYENGLAKVLFSLNSIVRHGLLTSLHLAHKLGWGWDAYTCSTAARNGHLECLKYLHENGCPWDKDTTSSAGAYGHLDCLQYAHTNGCPLPDDICDDCAAYGQLECLKYVRNAGCPWDETTTYCAALGTHLTTLRYLHEQGCPWDTRLTSTAAKYGFTESLVYAVVNGCPITEEARKSEAVQSILEMRAGRSNREGSSADDVSISVQQDGIFSDCADWGTDYKSVSGARELFK